MTREVPSQSAACREAGWLVCYLHMGGRIQQANQPPPVLSPPVHLQTLLQARPDASRVLAQPHALGSWCGPAGALAPLGTSPSPAEGRCVHEVVVLALGPLALALMRRGSVEPPAGLAAVSTSPHVLTVLRSPCR